MYWVQCHHYSVIHIVQPKHSLLSVKRLQRRSQTALGGWMGGRWRKKDRKRVLVSLSFPLSWGKWFSSLPFLYMKPKSIPTSRALDLEYSRWWHFTICGRWGFAGIGESVWSIDHCCCCPCLLCLCVPADSLSNSETKTDTERQLVL